QATAERDERLVGTGAVSRQEYDVSIGKLGVSQAEVRKAEAAIDRAKLDLDFTKITAPITGKIGRAQVDLGNLVNSSGAETVLTKITSVDPIYVYFNVDERALLRYLKEMRRDGAKKKDGDVGSLKERKIPVEVGLDGEDGFPHVGVLDFADNQVNPSTGT